MARRLACVLAVCVSVLSGCHGAKRTPETAVQRPEADSIAARYEDVAHRILSAALADTEGYKKLEYLCLRIGHRLSGSRQLEEAVRWAADTMRRDGLVDVRLEAVAVPVWRRGEESVELVSPRQAPMHMLGLGGSVGTPAEGITAPVVVVSNEAELEALGESVEGKIVLFNNPMPPYEEGRGASYGTTVRFRTNGARLAAAQGAVAALVRSVTAHSLRSPHTGAMRYKDAKRKIPAAAISTEDAELLARLYRDGVTPVVRLKMGARTLPDGESANVVGEIKGRERPEEIVVIGGHIDSWDVGQGAHDDGAGCVMAMQAAALLKNLDLIPRRTIRVVLWTNEENGLRGASRYAEVHAEELARHVAAIESDSGAFRPVGYSVQCDDKARERRAADQVRDLIRVLDPIGATRVATGYSGADISPMRPAGVVGLGHRVEGSRYFDYHHSHADTIDKIIPSEFAENVAAMATVAYILADMPQRLGDRPHRLGDQAGR